MRMTPMHVPTRMEPDRYKVNYEVIVRQMITREDELTNQRMLWMAAFNGLLLTALGFAWDKKDANDLTVVFSFLGFASSFLTVIPLFFASNAQRRLLLWWRENQPHGYKGPGVIGGKPVKGDEKLYTFFFTPWIILAVVFAVGWARILYIVCHRS